MDKKYEVLETLQEAIYAAHHIEYNISNMLETNHDLILTGSRYFGNISDDSSYDFFIDSHRCGSKMMQQLIDLGFELVVVNESRYDNDPSNLYVMRYVGTIVVDIHVVRASCYERKLDARMLLKDAFDQCPAVMKYLDKDQIAMIWRDMMNTYKAFG